jgi:hypothetical protein
MKKILLQRTETLVIIACMLSATLCFTIHAYAEESLLCAEEIEKFCKDIKPGGGRIMECLKAHESELCGSCREKIGELQGIIKDCEQACSGDIAQFCKEVQPGGGRILKCLREHDKELSPSCSAKLEMIGNRLQRGGGDK